MQRLKSILSAIIVTVVLVASLDYAASAATGKPFLLGKINKANHTTTVKNTGNGPAAKFVSDAGDAPIKVSNNNLVKKLNADLLDGKHARELGVSARLYKSKFNLSDVSGFQIHIQDVPAGSYLGTFAGNFVAPAIGGNIDCAVIGTMAPVGTWMADYLDATGPGFYFPLHGADVVVVQTKQDLIAQCTGDTGQWAGEVRVGLTRIDDIMRTTVAAGPA